MKIHAMDHISGGLAYTKCGSKVPPINVVADSAFATCKKCQPKRPSKPLSRPVTTPVSRAAARLIHAMEKSEHERYTMIDHFVGEKPHAMVIVAVTPEHCAKILKQLKKWLNLPKRET